MPLLVWIGAAIICIAIGLIVYWLLIITEGTYLGQPIVTWMYDLVAERYDSIKEFDKDIESAYLGRPLASELGAMQAHLILDVGTGTGRLPLTLFEQPRFQGRIVGVDASKRMLEVASKQLLGYAGRWWLIHQSAMELPFKSESFDAVTMLEMLEFTPNPIMVIKEAIRVLRPGGLLLTTRRAGFDAKLIPGKTYSEKDFRHLLSELGLEQVRIERWQIDYDLVWATRSGQSVSLYSQLVDVLECPNCDGRSQYELNDRFACGMCGYQFVIVD